MIVRVGLRFAVDRREPPNRPLHDALEAVRIVEVEAPSIEVGEHYTDLLRRALERAGS